jgi:hypothetical protein
MACIAVHDDIGVASRGGCQVSRHSRTGSGGSISSPAKITGWSKRGSRSTEANHCSRLGLGMNEIRVGCTGEPERDRCALCRPEKGKIWDGFSANENKALRVL